MLRSLLASFAIVSALAVADAAELDPTSIRAAAQYSASHRGLSFLVLQHGRTLSETKSRTPFKIFSGTKAFWNLAALAAAEDGFLNLDEPVARTIAAWRNDSRKSHVTIRQLLDFSCGLDPGFFLHENSASDRDRLALNLPIVASPGSAFIYGPSALQVFHEVLKEKLQGQTPTHFLERRVLHPLGLGAQRYLDDRAGNPLLAAGWELSARQWARLGNLALANGAPVISTAAFANCLRGSSVNRAFAFGWWNNRAAPGGREFDFEKMLAPKWPRQEWSNACICRDAPADLIECIGSEGQRLFVIPSFDLVVVRQGGGGEFSDARFLRLLLGRAQ